MDLFNRSELRRLAEVEDEVCVSLYMPTFRNESDWSQNTTRLKNLIRDARNQLREQDYREDRIDDILADARQLLDRPGFWRKSIGDGLALFVGEETTESFRLPLTFDEVAVVDRQFHLKPLFPLIASNNRFYLLALSQNDVRLYQGTHQSLSEVESAEIPGDIVAALEGEEDDERHLQSHVQNRGSEVDGERQDAAFHGHGGGDEDDVTGEPQDRLKRFFREIDENVSSHLNGEEVPLVLAGVSEYLPMYREANSYPSLIDDDIVPGNPESLGPDTLHEKSWALVEPVFREEETQEIERFEQLYYQEEDMASEDLHRIIPGCAFGQVDTLFVPLGEHRWGRFDPESNTVTVHEEQKAGDGDLLNYAAVSAYLNGATVHALSPEKMPGGRGLAATFRYKADVAATESS